MSKKQLATSVANYDVGLVFKAGGIPAAVVPVTDRARKLFISWGMSDTAVGIVPPFDPSTLTTELPGDFLVGIHRMKPDFYELSKIPLPPINRMVH